MTETTNVGLNNLVQQYGVDQKIADNTPEKTEKDDFMTMLIAQVQNQDPTNPQESGEFLSQIATFEMVDQQAEQTAALNNLNNTFLSSQRLNATSLIGRSVSVNTNQAILEPGGEVSGIADLQTAGNVTVNIENAFGESITQIDLGRRPAGEVSFTWDGKNSQGVTVPPGSYRVAASTEVDGEAEAVDIQVDANVDSVSIASDGTIELNVAGVGKLPIDSVKVYR